MKAIIVAGGKGERLRPLTNTIPKPMVDVAGKPILEHIVDLFKRHGVSEFIFALCYLPHVITDYFGDGKKFGVSIHYTFEDENSPMGTAGAILAAKKLIGDTFIVTYADILRELDFTAMIHHHKKFCAFTSLHVYKRYGPDPKSLIIFNHKKRVTKFIEQPKSTDIKENFVWANGSFYILEPGIFDFIQKNISSDFGKDIFPALLRANKLVIAYPSNGLFIDIGNLKKLEKARRNFI